MTRAIRVCVLMVLAASGITLAADSFNLTSTWKAPGEGPLDFKGKKVVALVVTNDVNLRMSAEEALVREISARGPQAVASYRVIPREELTDVAKVKGWLERSQAAGVVALRLVNKEQQKVYSAMVWSSGYYGNFYSYYDQAWATATPIGKGRIETTLTVETLMYRVADAKLLWAGVSETTDPKDTTSYMKGLTKVVVKELEKQGLVRKGSK